MNKTAISYLDRAWNPVTGCSFGCPECWARAMAHRFGKSFEPTFHPDKLGQPAKRKKPATVGVCFTGDLFDTALGPKAAEDVLYRALETPRHTYVFLTKRAGAMSAKMSLLAHIWGVQDNWFLGVTVRNQSELDAAAPHIRAMAKEGWKVWLSIEPIQEEIILDGACLDLVCDQDGDPLYYKDKHPIVGVILGGQSGPGAEPLPVAWVRTIRDQCAAAGVPFMFKQVSSHKIDRYWPHHDGFPELDGRTHTALAWPLHEKVLPA